jgi:hypothetical protein
MASYLFSCLQAQGITAAISYFSPSAFLSRILLPGIIITFIEAFIETLDVVLEVSEKLDYNHNNHSQQECGQISFSDFCFHSDLFNG